MTAELVLDARNIVGESLIWDGSNDRLLWVDIVNKTINALTPQTGEHLSWNTSEFVTSIGLRQDGGALVGLTKALCLWDFGDTFTKIATIESDLPDNRLNEGVVGPDGCFWVGTMQNNINPDGSPSDIREDTGRLYRCTPKGEIESLSDDLFGITNTLVWTDDDGLITADTLKNELYHYSYDPKTGGLSNRRVILPGFDRGLPDGSTMDAEGYVWNCRVAGGGCLVRMDQSGKIDQVVELPCSWPTSCAFGGKDLDTLYVTSARFTMDINHLASNPQEGGLFAVKPGVIGLPCHRFG